MSVLSTDTKLNSVHCFLNKISLDNLEEISGSISIRK